VIERSVKNILAANSFSTCFFTGQLVAICHWCQFYFPVVSEACKGWLQWSLQGLASVAVRPRDHRKADLNCGPPDTFEDMQS